MDRHPDETLVGLLLEIFSPDELRALLAADPETRPLLVHLPGPTASHHSLTSEAVELLRRHGLINAALLERLVVARPRHADRIRAALGEAGEAGQGLEGPESSEGRRELVVQAEGHARLGRFAFRPDELVAELLWEVQRRWALPRRERGRGPVTLRYQYELFWEERPLRPEEPLGEIGFQDGALLRLLTRVHTSTDAEIAEGAAGSFGFWGGHEE